MIERKNYNPPQPRNPFAFRYGVYFIGIIFLEVKNKKLLTTMEQVRQEKYEIEIPA